MENSFDREGSWRFATAPALRDELIASLTSFVGVYGRHSGGLQEASERFDVAGSEMSCLGALIAGVLGAASGGVSGGVCGTFGAVSAATVGRLLDDITALDAAVGAVGSVMGGVIGGALAGAVGSAVGCTARAKGSRVQGFFSDVAVFTIGFATGGSLGGVFGGSVGAAGGATYATRVVVGLVGDVNGGYCGSKEQNLELRKGNVLRERENLWKHISPLVEEVQKIKMAGDKLVHGALVHGVAGHAAETLESVMAMEETLRGSESAGDLPQFVSSVDAAVTQSKRIGKELETTRREAENLLMSVSER